MSTQFKIEANPNGRFVLAAACLEPGETTTFNDEPSYATFEAAVADADIHMLSCEDCMDLGCHTQIDFDLPSGRNDVVAMSTLDARLVLDRLGITLGDDGDVAGTLPAADFHSRVLAALALLGDDSGVRSIDDTAPGRARIAYGRVEAGATESMLRDLHDLAAEAVALGRDVQWY